MPKRRSYVGELEWVIDHLIVAHSDRNPNRAAQIDGLLRYANKVLVARRGKEPIPPRPKVEEMM